MLDCKHLTALAMVCQEGGFDKAPDQEPTMIQLRESRERGHFQSDWLDNYHTFSSTT